MVHRNIIQFAGCIPGMRSFAHIGRTGASNTILPRETSKIHEYQGKEILRSFGVPVPRGIPAFTVQEAVEAAQKLGGPVRVVRPRSTPVAVARAAASRSPEH